MTGAPLPGGTWVLADGAERTDTGSEEWLQVLECGTEGLWEGSKLAEEGRTNRRREGLWEVNSELRERLKAPRLEPPVLSEELGTWPLEPSQCEVSLGRRDLAAQAQQWEAVGQLSGGQ